MKKAFFRVKIAGFVNVVFLAVVSFTAGPVVDDTEAAGETRYIRDNSGGGDCTQVGIWSSDTKTCTLTADVQGKFVIESDNVTLDGGGHRVTGTGPENPADFRPGADGGGNGVYLYGRSGVNVKNLVMHRFDYSVDLVDTSNSTISGITSTSTGLAGISLHNADNNLFSANTISNADINTGICVGYDSDNNQMTGNDISHSSRGIYLHTSSSGNRISGNTLNVNEWSLVAFEADTFNVFENNSLSNSTIGVYLHDRSDSNTVRGNTFIYNATGIQIEGVAGSSVYQNSFVANAVSVVAIGGSANAFDMGMPMGGNHWSNFDSAAEGCADADGNGFCDSPLEFSGGTDNHPWTSPSAWQCSRQQLELSAPQPFWASFSDYQQSLLSLEWTVNNNGTNSAIAAHILNSICTNGVVVAESLPVEMGTIGAGMSVVHNLKYSVPAGVSIFRAGLNLDSGDLCGNDYHFPTTPGPSV